MELLQWPNKPKTSNFELDVPFNDQNDNKSGTPQGQGYRHCNITCAAMIVKYLKKEIWLEYNDFANGAIDTLNKLGGDTTDHAAITAVMKSLGVQSDFIYDGNIQLLQKSLFLGVPVLVGTKYKVGGHMIVIKGRGDGYFTAHNPYGSRAGTTDNWNYIGNGSGKNEKLSASWMKACVADLGPNSVWMRVIKSVDGVKTGL